MPFITNATDVSGFSNGAMPAATAGNAGAFTVTITASCGPSALGIVTRLHAHVELAIAGMHRQAVALDGRQMRATRQHGHVRTAACEAHRQMAADSAGAVNANPHSSLPGDCARVWRQQLARRQPEPLA